MNKTRNTIQGLNSRLERSFQQGNLCRIDMSAQPFATVDTIAPLEFDRISPLKRHELVGNFAIRNFATSAHSINTARGIYGIYPILCLAGSLYMFRFNTPDLRSILNIASEHVDYPIADSHRIERDG